MILLHRNIAQKGVIQKFKLSYGFHNDVVKTE